ncbi:hypothetical protein GPECTOR_44g81 [Gonium pectorale]|uniref:AB hydrolase-1 domain-containing protein n=1 Tax=Gonium pectorale TaxID=33097 RepID=A0A150G989_GONPE|nr:hypothetical protein GPECTOR_44g81 [Gonium pectorale]|eukprot:KXZ46407.1 hypothetical protein GPECTOR_44g81 [Gonium pectorale]
MDSVFDIKVSPCKRQNIKGARPDCWALLQDERSDAVAKRGIPSTRHGRRKTAVPVAAAAAGAFAPAPPSPSTPGTEEDLAVDLDYVPSLGPLRELICVMGPVMLVLAAYVATGRWHGNSLVAKLASVVAAASCVSLLRSSWTEKEYKARERAHAVLGDRDSHFRPISTSAAGAGPGSSVPLVVHVKVKVGDVAAQRGSAAGAAGASASADGTGAALAGIGTAPEALCAVHCYHGFGANLGSYKRVQDQMAAVLRGVVTSHDMPGFGLTQRPSEMSSYFLTFNGRLGRLVLDYELQQLGLLAGGDGGGGGGRAPAGSAVAAAATAAAEPQRATGGDSVQSSIAAPSAGGGAMAQSVKAGAEAGARPPIKRILLGHSLGGACAALEAVTGPEGLAGLVLVAPAVFALPGPEYAGVTLSPDHPNGAAASDSGAGGEEQRTAAAREAAHLGSEPTGSHVTDPPEVRRLYPVGRVPTRGSTGAAAGGEAGGAGGAAGAPRRLLKACGALLGAVASLALLLVLRLLAPIITLLLRSLVRRRTFWIKGLQQAYYNPDLVTSDIVDSYRMPQLVRGWEAGMVNFLLARLARPRGGITALFKDAFQGVSAASNAVASRGAAAAATATAAAKADAEASALQPSSSSDGNKGDDADLASRLSALVSERRLPVLIVHGMYDKLVPASNSQRLARMLPGCELVLLDRCGHMPQEEMPGLFVDLVAEFAAKLEPQA